MLLPRKFKQQYFLCNDIPLFHPPLMYPFFILLYSVSRTGFITNQIAYFGAVVTSSNAAVLNRTILANSVCFQIGAGACQSVEFTELSDASGKDPIFSVDLGSAGNSAVFAVLDASPASAQFYQVKATVEVLFVGGVSKRMDVSGVSSRSDLDERSSKYNRPVGVVTAIEVVSANAREEEDIGSSAHSLRSMGYVLLAVLSMCVF